MVLHHTACWWKLNFLLHVHCLLVEAAFLTVHAEHGCDNLSKLHDFILYRLLVEAKFLTARANLVAYCTVLRHVQSEM